MGMYKVTFIGNVFMDAKDVDDAIKQASQYLRSVEAGINLDGISQVSKQDEAPNVHECDATGAK